MARSFLKGRGTIEVVGRFFILVYTENQGAFLSLGSSWPAPVRLAVLIIGPIILILVMLVYAFVSRELRMAQIAGIACIVGGGLSNLVDRIIFDGRVVDFANIGIGRLRTGIFNCADLSVMIGAAIFLFASGKRKQVTET